MVASGVAVKCFQISFKVDRLFLIDNVRVFCIVGRKVQLVIVERSKLELIRRQFADITCVSKATCTQLIARNPKAKPGDLLQLSKISIVFKFDKMKLF